MAIPSATHGSELHLLRYLGRHRDALNTSIRSALKKDCDSDVTDIEWLDYPFDPNGNQKDGEWLGVDFIEDFGGEEWRMFWPDKQPGLPSRKGAMAWDAIGRISVDGRPEWLLVEAKAHTGELRNPSASCRAKGQSLLQIEASLRATWSALVPVGQDWEKYRGSWLGMDYQKANRLACLHFLNSVKCMPARLLYIYFIGDSFPDAPVAEQGWVPHITAQYSAMGIAGIHFGNVHSIILPVCSNNNR